MTAAHIVSPSGSSVVGAKSLFDSQRWNPAHVPRAIIGSGGYTFQFVKVRHREGSNWESDRRGPTSSREGRQITVLRPEKTLYT